jgi:hypothetical protein
VGSYWCINSLWNQSKIRRREKEKKRTEKKKKKKKEKKEKRNQGKLLPTTKIRTGNLPSRVVGQLLNHDVLSTYMRHFIQDDIYPLKDVIQDFMTTSSSLPKRCTIGPLPQLNSMVSSWTTKGKSTTAGSLLVFEDKVGEDGLSSQTTYKVNIDCLYYKACIAPNPKVLNDLKLSKEKLENVYGGIMKEVNDLRLQIDSKNIKAKASILILPKLKPKMFIFAS